MQFDILGPLQVLDAGRPLVLGRPKQRAVLAILLLDAGRVYAEGTHEELMENSPLYRELVETQMIEAEDLSGEGRS